MKSHKFLSLSIVLLVVSACGEKVNSIDSIEKSSIDYGIPSLINENYVHRFGRQRVDEDGLYMALSGTGIEFSVNVSNETNTIKLLLNSSSTSDYQYLDIVVDNVFSSRLTLNKGDQEIEIISSLTPGNHTIRVIKSNESSVGKIKIKDIDFEGCNLVLFTTKYDKRIEFYGDSITSSYGVLGTMYDPFSAETQDAYNGYAYKTAEKLGYDYSIVSQSGISVAMNAFNSEYYFKHLYPTYDGRNQFDLTSYKVDIAVVNLGTNDNTKFNQFDSKTQLEQVEVFYQEYLNLTKSMKDNNPDCQFVLCYNMMIPFNAYLVTALNGVAKWMNEEYGDCVSLLEFNPDNHGSDAHPGKDAHATNADILAEFIQTL